MLTWLAGKKERQKKGLPIEDYAMIGDFETAALVSREGSINWLCWPNFSSGACFASLLGGPENGYWQLSPAGEIQSSQRRYRLGTLILETTFVTKDGEVCLIDFMPPRGKYSDVIRIVEGVRGKVKMRMELVLRFDYGLSIPWVTMHKNELRAVAGSNMVVLRCACSTGTPAELHGEGLSTVSEFRVMKGERKCFTLTYAPSVEKVPDPVPTDAALDDTQKFWTEWTAHGTYRGPYEEAVQRSLITLKAMTYKPSGGIVAAVTAGLPEEIGGERNWDYRYCWLRDTSFTLLVLMRGGYMEEAIDWRLWLLRAIAGAPEQLQTLYGLCGERTIVEWTPRWLAGYEKSRPVRIGNAAAEQFQLDVYGEVAAALERTPEAADDIRVPSMQVQASLVDHLCKVWRLPDDGIWEARSKRRHYVYSKVMAWVALDRAIKYYERFDRAGNVKFWRKNRDLLHKEICSKGFDKKLNSFTQYYGSRSLDASCLRLAMVGFLPLDDPRIIGTVDAIQKQLMKDGLVRRYLPSKSPDGLTGGEGTFLPCSFWLVICLHLLGRKDEAKEYFERLLALRNDVGLMSEEYDSAHKRMLGNFPQALTHLSLAHAAYTLGGQWTPGVPTSH